MKSRFIVLMLLVFAAALFTGCATTGDLEKLQAQVKQTDMKADQAAAKADMAAKDAAAAKATAAASQADCAKASEACNAAAAKAEQAAARADASGQAGRGQRQEDRSDVHEIHEKVEIRPRAETPEIGNEKAASDLSVTAFLFDSSPRPCSRAFLFINRLYSPSVLGRDAVLRTLDADLQTAGVPDLLHGRDVRLEHGGHLHIAADPDLVSPALPPAFEPEVVVIGPA